VQTQRAYGRYSNQASVGTIVTLWLTRTKTPAH